MSEKKDQRPESPKGSWKWRAAVLVAVVILLASLAAIVIGLATTHHDDSLAYATWVLALLTLFLAVGIPVTISVSTTAQVEQEQDQFYAQLDGTYLEIQKLIIDYPHLGDPAALLKNPEANPEQLTQYDAFAFIVWNFIESIYDFTHKDDDSPQRRRMNDMLSQSWECIVDHEGARHAQWFVLAKNQKKFKKSFCDYVASKLKGWNATLPAAPKT